MRIKVDNQWGKQEDHLDDVSGLTSRDLYFAMLDPISASQELSELIRRNKDHGTRNAWDELDYERLRTINNKILEGYNSTNNVIPVIPYREIEMDVINTLANTFAGDKPQPDEWERPGILSKLGQLMPNLPRDSQLRIQREEVRLGLLSRDQYKRQLIEYGKFTRTDQATEAQINEFPRLLSELSKDEQFQILDTILGINTSSED